MIFQGAANTYHIDNGHASNELSLNMDTKFSRGY